MDRTVVITGAGVVSGFGLGMEALWEGMCEGRPTFTPIEGFDTSGFECGVAASATGFAVRDHVPRHYRKAVKVMARDTELAVVAASLAARSAGVVTKEVDDGEPTCLPGRLGCQIGAGLIAAETDELTRALVTASSDDGFSLARWGDEGMDNLQPLWMLKYLPNMLSCHVTIIHGAEGPSNTITCAESSGLLSIGESRHVIERDDADLCFSGGAESKLNLLGMMRASLSGRLSATGDVRPYDTTSTGSVPGEGAGILMLESSAHARERGARALARIEGFGAATSIGSTMPPIEDRDPDGLRMAIEGALADAGLEASAIDAIVPHGVGIASTDAVEASALRSVFGSRLASIPLVTWTPSIGNLSAGNGGVQAAIGAWCLSTQRLPARIHAGTPESDLQAGACEARDASLRHVLVCSMALGGPCAALVLGLAE